MPAPMFTPPAVVNDPPAIRSPDARTAREPTSPPPTPDPSVDHVEPFQRAMPGTLLTLPAIVNPPAATSSPLGSAASANTRTGGGGRGLLGRVKPLPKGSHSPVPGLYRAMLLARMLPAT